MSLYDDDTVTDKSAASGWASGIKLMQNQLAFKKASVTAPKRDCTRKKFNEKLPPVINLKSKREEEENTPPYFMGTSHMDIPSMIPSEPPDVEWKFEDEYDPFWPNEYDKVVKDMREKRDREEDEKRRHDREERSRQRRERFKDEEDSDRGRSRRSNNRGSGAAIAPPPSLDIDQDPEMPLPSKSYSGVGGSVAAKIMAKYGFKEGQGLGKSKQGIVRALEVEKTSKRGGRIIKEDELEYGVGSNGDSPPPRAPTPPSFTMPPVMPPPSSMLSSTPFLAPPNPEPKIDNISDVLKTPSKVLILLNMVGPGEVDDDLEPEVREECSSKYGPVTKVIIFEIPRTIPEEAVRIFIEFQRVEAAVKALIDLNGRFFGGRQVKAGFYDYESYKSYKLNEHVEF